MTDHLPVAAGSGGSVVPATVGGDLTTHHGDHGSEPSRTAAAAQVSAPTEALGATLNGLAAELRLTEHQLQGYRAWAARNHEQLGEALYTWATEQEKAADEAACTECTRVLRAEWGSSYDSNRARIKGWLAAQPPALAEAILQARFDSGSWVCNDPRVMRALLQVSAGAAPTVDVDKRIAEIQGLMANTSGKYWKGPDANSLQAEYRDLIRQREQRRS